MALDPHEPDPLYQLGRLLALAELDGEETPPTLFDQLTITPVAGLGLLARRLDRVESRDGDTIGAIMARLEGAALPAGPTKIEERGPFWVGYYRQRYALAATQQMTPDDLRQAGVAIFGDRWQADMTEALGLHDSARLRSWLRGDKPVPRGVAAEVTALARQRAALATDVADRMSAFFGPRSPEG